MTAGHSSAMSLWRHAGNGALAKWSGPVLQGALAAAVVPHEAMDKLQIQIQNEKSLAAMMVIK